MEKVILRSQQGNITLLAVCVFQRRFGEGHTPYTRCSQFLSRNALIIIHIHNKLTNLFGNLRVQNNVKDTCCEINATLAEFQRHFGEVDTP